MKPRQEIVHDKRGKEHVHADNSWSVFLNAPQITLFDVATVHLWIRAAHRFSVDEGHVVNPAAKETREAGLDIMHGTGDTLYATRAIRIEAHTDIKIGHCVEGGEAVQHVTSFHAIHATKNNVALGDGSEGFRIDEIFLKWNYLLTETMRAIADARACTFGRLK